jgi:hypothetical protein
LESGIADIPVVLKQRADVDRLAAPEVAMYRPIEGELQRPAVERPGFAVSGVRRLVVEPWDRHVTDSAASLDDMVGGVYRQSLGVSRRFGRRVGYRFLLPDTNSRQARSRCGGGDTGGYLGW